MKSRTQTINETKKGNKLMVSVQDQPKKFINLVQLFKPYYEKGYRIKVLFHDFNLGILNATLIPS